MNQPKTIKEWASFEESQARESCRRLGLNEDSEWQIEAEKMRELRVRLKVMWKFFDTPPETDHLR